MSTTLEDSLSLNNGGMQNIELEILSENSYDCVRMDELYDDENNVATKSNTSSINEEKKPSVAVLNKSKEEETDNINNTDDKDKNNDDDGDDGKVISLQELSKILDAFSINNDNDTNKVDTNDDEDDGAVSSEMMLNLAKSVQNIKDLDVSKQSFDSSKFLGRARNEKNDGDDPVKMYIKGCENECSKVVGHLLGISSVAADGMPSNNNEVKTTLMGSTTTLNIEDEAGQNVVNHNTTAALKDDNNFSKTGNSLGISSVLVPNNEPKKLIESNIHYIEDSLLEHKDDQSAITILSSIYENPQKETISSPEQKIVYSNPGTMEVSSNYYYTNEESIDPIKTPHKKIYIIFLGLFLVVILGFTEKIYRMNKKMEHQERNLLKLHKLERAKHEHELAELKQQIELMHTKKVSSLLKERIELKQRIGNLTEKVKVCDVKQKPISRLSIDSIKCPAVSKVEPNDFSLFEMEEAEKRYQMGFKSCWVGEMEFSYKKGQCSSDLQDYFTKKISHTKDSFKKYVYGSSTNNDEKSEPDDEDDHSMAVFLVGNETVDFKTLMHRIATEPIRTTKDVLKSAIDVAKDSFYND